MHGRHKISPALGELRFVQLAHMPLDMVKMRRDVGSVRIKARDLEVSGDVRNVWDWPSTMRRVTSWPSFNSDLDFNNVVLKVVGAKGFRLLLSRFRDR